MSFKQAFNKYVKFYGMIEQCHRESIEFFSNLDLEYSLTYCVGDGVLILDESRALCGKISNDQVSRLSKSKTKEQALLVIGEINFHM
jgi:hypothetical protein